MLGLKRRKQAYGMYMTDTEIKLAAIRSHALDLKLDKRLSVPLAEGCVSRGLVQHMSAAAEPIGQAVREEGLEGAKVHLSVPVAKSIMRRLTLLDGSDAQLRSQIDVEINAWQFLPFKDFCFDYVSLGAAAEADESGAGNDKPRLRRAKKRDVLVFVTAREVVRQYAELARLAGLTPVSAELSPLALHRTLIRLDRTGKWGMDSLYAVLHAEAGEVNLSIFEDGVPVFMRTLHVNTSEPSLEMEAYYRNHAAQMTSAEIARMLNYYEYSVARNQNGVKKIYLAGDFRRVQTIADYLEPSFFGEILPLPVQLLLPEEKDIPYEFIVPIGLAMRGA